jgi:hypothetical protein
MRRSYPDFENRAWEIGSIQLTPQRGFKAFSMQPTNLSSL